jgi:hypothetical protein
MKKRDLPYTWTWRPLYHLVYECHDLYSIFGIEIRLRCLMSISTAITSKRGIDYRNFRNGARTNASVLN